MIEALVLLPFEKFGTWKVSYEIWMIQQFYNFLHNLQTCKLIYYVTRLEYYLEKL